MHTAYGFQEIRIHAARDDYGGITLRSTGPQNDGLYGSNVNPDDVGATGT